MKKFILGALVGAGLGAGVTYVIKQKEMDRVLQEQYDELKNYYETKPEEEVAEEIVEEEVIFNEETKTEYEELTQAYINEDIDATEEVNEYFDKTSYPSEEDEEYLEQQAFDNEMKKNEALGTIELIGEDEIGEMPGYDYLSLMYYTDDQTLVDDRVDIIPDIDKVLGVGVYSLTHTNHGDFVRVRNHRMSSDYEVEVVHGSYTELVLGIDTDAVADRHR